MSQLTSEDVGKMKVAELKTELGVRNLSTKGLKKELSERLIESLDTARGGLQGDPASQAAGEAPDTANAAEQGSANLPAEMPTVPPANEDSVQDLEGTEPTLSQEKAANGVETAEGPSQVVRPPPDSVNKIPGVVSDSRTDENRPIATDEASNKRKREDEPESSGQPGTPGMQPPVEPVAVQEEKMESGNDPVPAPPVDVDQPDLKRIKTDHDPVPQADDTAPDSSVPQASFGDDMLPTSASAEAHPSQAGKSVHTSNESSLAHKKSVPSFVTSAPADSTLIEEPKSVPSLKVKGASSSSAASHPSTDYRKASLPTGANQKSLVAAEADQGEKRITRPFSIKGSSKGSPVVNNSSSPKIEIGTSADVEKSTLSIKGSSSRNVSANLDSKEEEKEISIDPEVEGMATEAVSSASANDAPSSLLPVSGSTSKDRLSLVPPATFSAATVQADKPLDRDATTVSSHPPPSASVCVSNLVRPFTLSSLKGKLEECGEYSYFWINSVKSHCFVTYKHLESAIETFDGLTGEVWPEAVGKPLKITYLPTEQVTSLVEKEQAAGRSRMEFTAYQDPESSQWQYDLLPPFLGGAGGGRPSQSGAVIARGLASSVPIQARSDVSSNPFPLGRPEQPPADPNLARARAPLPASGSRLFQQAQNGRATVTTASGTPITIPANSGFAQTRKAQERVNRNSGDADQEIIWQPASGAETAFKQTKTLPSLWYKPVDLMSAGRKLREMEKEQRRYQGWAPRISRGGIRDSYRP